MLCRPKPIGGGLSCLVAQHNADSIVPLLRDGYALLTQQQGTAWLVVCNTLLLLTVGCHCL
jgi:hypothetical protein